MAQAGAGGEPASVRFDTVTFWIFFVAAWAIWRLLPFRAAKFGTLLSSLFFYAWWRPEYLVLILASTIVDFRASLCIEASESQRRRNAWLLASMAMKKMAGITVRARVACVSGILA